MSSSDQSIDFHTGEPAFAVDRNGRVVAWNDSAESAFGYKEEDALGHWCWELLRGEDSDGNLYCCKHCPRREMAIQNKPPNRAHLRFRTASGKLDDFTVSTVVVHDEAGGEVLINLCGFEKTGNGSGGVKQKKPAPGVGPDVLTPREMEVLGYLAEGHSTRDMAATLNITVPTVRNHIEHMLHKLNAHSRLEAVAVCRRMGLI